MASLQTIWDFYWLSELWRITKWMNFCFLASDLIVLKHSSTCQILTSSPTLTGLQLPNMILYLSMHDICCLKLILWCVFLWTFLYLLTQSHLKVKNENLDFFASQADLYTHCISMFMQNSRHQDVNPKMLVSRFSVPLFHIIFSILKLIQYLYFNLNICQPRMYLLTVL